MQNLFTAPVVWFLIGMVLFLAELVLPGLIVMFFGAGAWITAICCLLFHVGINTQLVIFLLSSVLSLFLLRKTMLKKYSDRSIGSSAAMEDEYVGQTAIAVDDFDANFNGKVFFKGSTWDASATSVAPIVKGQQLLITGFKSIKLFVEPLNN